MRFNPQVPSAIPAIQEIADRDLPVRESAGAEERAEAQSLTAAKMKEMTGPLKPVLMGQLGFPQWMPDSQFEASRFIVRREDKSAKDVHRE